MTYANLSWNRTFDNNKKYVWVTESGSNVCDVCKSLNGKIFSGNKIPPKPHPNCRCEIMEEPVYKNYQVKMINIKTLIRENVIQETEKLLSQKQVDNDPLAKEMIRVQRFNLRQKIANSTIIAIENDIIASTAWVDEKNIEKLIGILTAKELPPIFKNIFAIEKQKYQQQKNKEEKERKPKSGISELVGKSKLASKQAVHWGQIVYNSPTAEKFLLIGIDDINNDYLKNVKVYNKIEELEKTKLKRTIKSLIKEDNELYKKYDMPAIANCKTYWFNEKHEVAKKIANSYAVKMLVSKKLEFCKTFNPTDENPAYIEFKNKIDTDLYYAIHNARVTRLQTNYQNRIIKVRIEDLYDFDPRKKDLANRLGAELQRNGKLKPYYIVIDVNIPY